jgi:hypothetical protein
VNLRLVSLTAITVAGLAAPAPAHHSFAMFDADRTYAVQATVKEFEWVNPHSSLRIMVKDERTGRPVLWTLEWSAPAQLAKMGIYPNSMRPGDVVSVTFHPMRDGSPRGLVVSGAVAR